jgi:hypothetical protein
MKYQVQISYTNPSHEHVTLRRRVETVTRLVEASTEGEALNRAANQQRALGFRIQEAKVVKPASLNEEVESVDEASKNLRYDASAPLQTTAPVVKNWQQAQSGDPRAKSAWAKHVRRIQKVEPTGMSKKDIQSHMQSNFGEEFGADKRDAGYKMSPAVRKAQGESDRLSKVVKPVQAGTLAAQRRRAEMKKEAVEPGETRVVNKAVKTSKKATKAAEKMVSAAKGKLNKINVKPTMDLTGQEKTHSKA